MKTLVPEEPDWLQHRVTRIDDAEDDRLAPYRNVRERDLVGREGRFIELHVEAFDELDQIGVAEHQRAVVDVERYTARLNAKLEKLAELEGSTQP